VLRCIRGTRIETHKDRNAHPSVPARANPDRIAYRMAGSRKAITYHEFSDQRAHLIRSLGGSRPVITSPA
jgi:hypothetical protein